MTSFQFVAVWIRAHAREDRGASLVEYALLVALIAIVCIAAITMLGSNSSEKFDTVASSIG
jgi:pilus assembly protein Flp/PilA